MNGIKFSIVIPTYNMSTFILESIESCIKQTYKNFEVIIIDNNSIDNTEEILKPFLTSNIYYYKNDTNIGAINNFNLAIELSKGDYIKFLEADDFLSINCLEVLEKKIKLNSFPDMIATGRYYINSNSKVYSSFSVNKQLFFSKIYSNLRILVFGNEFGTPSDIVVKSTVFNDNYKFDTLYIDYLNDWDLWIRIARSHNVLIINDKLCYVRRHDSQMGNTGAITNRDVEVNYRMINKLFKPYTLSFFLIILKSFSYYIYRSILKFLKSQNNFTSIIDIFNKTIQHFTFLQLLILILISPFLFLIIYLLKFYYCCLKR